MDFEKTAAYLEQEEGYRPHTYRCTGGALTIGFNPRPREGATLYPLLAPFIG